MLRGKSIFRVPNNETKIISKSSVCKAGSINVSDSITALFLIFVKYKVGFVVYLKQKEI